MNNIHLRRAIALAAEAAGGGNRPFGAVLVGENGTVIAEGRNEVTSSGDPTAHAELVAIRGAANGSTTNATMFASGEPCPMCSAAMVWAGITHIVFAATESEFSKILDGGPRFKLGCAEIIAAADVEVSVIGPLLEAESLAAMRG
ncbi:nucleoside deaminase [Rhodococcus globerulus]|uniref:nucleoside deaminase n=1 Tax=Rhodococcus globerulus TaxID=33008 RepID=UPI00301755D6